MNNNTKRKLALMLTGVVLTWLLIAVIVLIVLYPVLSSVLFVTLFGAGMGLWYHETH